MDSIFQYNDIASFLKDWLNSNKQRGTKGLLADQLRIHPTLLSQILAGQRQFTEDQIFELGKYISLNPLEEQYLDTLGRLARASRASYQKELQKQLHGLKEKSKKLSERIDVDHTLKDKERAVFYSSWKYSAIRMACSVGKARSTEDLHQILHIPKSELQDKLNFLESAGLIAKENSLWVAGAKRTHLEKGSAYLPRHHTNWRIRGIQRCENIGEEEMMYTSPLTISKKDFQKVKEKILQLIADTSKIVKNTEPEQMACLCLDFFHIND